MNEACEAKSSHMCLAGNDLGWLPRRLGFRFIGVRADGSTLNCIMRRHVSAFPLFYVANEATGDQCFHELVAWRQHK